MANTFSQLKQNDQRAYEARQRQQEAPLFTKSGQNVIPIGARRPSIPEKSASLSSTYQNMS